MRDEIAQGVKDTIARHQATCGRVEQFIISSHAAEYRCLNCGMVVVSMTVRQEGKSWVLNVKGLS